MDTPNIIAALPPDRAARFQTALLVLEEGLENHHIWNTDYTDAKDMLSRRMEEAIKVAAEPFYNQRREDYLNWGNDDPRHDVSGYLSYTSAPKLLRRLEKANFPDPVIQKYMEYVREIVEVGNLIKATKPYIEKGRKPNPNAKPADLSNTGTCAICFNRQKLAGGEKLVQHGYQISDGFGNYFGFRSGICFGVGHSPYELSNEANVAYKKALSDNLVNIKTRLTELKTGKITEIVRMERERQKGFAQKPKHVAVTYKKGEDKWDEVKAHEIQEVTSAIKAFEDEIELQITRIQEWEEKPLP